MASQEQKIASPEQRQDGDKSTGSWGRALGIWTLNILALSYVAPRVGHIFQSGPAGEKGTASAPFDPDQERVSLVDADRIACEQFLASPSALQQFEGDARFSLINAGQQFRPADLAVRDPRRQQLDLALDEAQASFQFAPPELTLSEQLRAFQRYSDLRGDGVYGPQTANALIRALYGEGETAVELFFENQQFSPLRDVRTFRPELRDEEDPARRALEIALDVVGECTPYLTYTPERLEAFQSAQGLRVDGEFGDRTRFALARVIFREPELADAVALRCGIEEGSGQTFFRFVDHLIRREGGANAVENLQSEDQEVRAHLLIHDPGDPGGLTFCGITLNDYRQRVNPEATSEALGALSYEDVRDYYYNEYFCRQNLTELPPAVAYICSDAAVNHGAGRLSRFCEALGLPAMSGLPAGSLPYVQRQALARLADPTVLDESGAEALVQDLFQLRIGLYEELRPELRSRYMTGWLNRLRDVNTFLHQDGCYGERCQNEVAQLIQTAEDRELARRRGGD